MSPIARFASDYVAALRRHVVRPHEATLREGYELGRRAVAEEISALDLTTIHHEALSSALRKFDDGGAADVVRAAGTFSREVLSAFEMVHRGFREVASAAAAERRNAAMLRRLSSFLTDASLSTRDADVAGEVLHLVAEHARELTGAAYCMARWGEGEGMVRARSPEEDSPSAQEESIVTALEQAADALPTRVVRQELLGHPSLREFGVVSNVLTVALATLDGRPIGCLQLVDKRGGDFTAEDEAIAVQLADLAAGALERAELYRGRIARR